jgi:hypothetical protein
LHSYSVTAMHALSLSFLLSRYRAWCPFSQNPDLITWVVSLCLDDFRLVSLKFVEHFPINHSSTISDKASLISEVNACRMNLLNHGLVVINQISPSMNPCSNNVFPDTDKISSNSFTTPIWSVIPVLITSIFTTLYSYHRLWADPNHIIGYLCRIVSLCRNHLLVVEVGTLERSVYDHFISSFLKFCSYLPIEFGTDKVFEEFLDPKRHSSTLDIVLLKYVI